MRPTSWFWFSAALLAACTPSATDKVLASRPASFAATAAPAADTIRLNPGERLVVLAATPAPPPPPPADSVVLPPADTTPPAPPPPPPPPAGARGVGLGAWHLPPDSLGKSAYTATTVNGSSGMAKELDRVKAAKGQVSVSVARAASLSGGQFSVAAVCANLKTWPDLTPYRTQVRVVVVADDISSAFNGPNAPYYDRIDASAKCVHDRWPWLATAVRQKPSALGSYSWRWLDNGWAQYDGPQRDGTPAAYVAKEQAAAKARGLGLILGLNHLDGGDGSSKILGTFPGAAAVNRWQMSGKEVSTVGRVFLAAGTCLLEGWTYSRTWTGTDPNRTAAQIAGIKAFDTRADVRAALADLRSVADTLPARACFVR